ncbi:D-amino-acid oxidase [Hypsizygus marmoreus]|uniref:D-amino-acid oxidase n=1 Tax=Hypsizygus marmoreus TaxID=39966 RepID=A0A369KD21_HYPMA|nr:D-amino-acid oxidase [Hypsizygus marmoreus]
MEGSKKVIVLGAGVVGLTTAVKIQERGGYQVTVIAEVLPTDDKTIRYTSHWAGAHHVLNATEDDKQQKMDIDTFDVLWELSEPGSETEKNFLRVTQTEYYCDHKFVPPLERMPDHKLIPKELLPAGVVHGLTFTSITLDTPKYLPYLASRFTAAGGKIIKASVQHINQVVEGGESAFSSERNPPSPPDAVLVCTGIGTRFLGGVEDKDMYPIRGQTVLIRAPWIKFGRTIGHPDGTWTYVIPRRSGDIILGGTKDANDWYPHPRPETTRDILERNFAMCPELAPPEIREKRTPTIEDVIALIIEEGCGLRPARKGGIRLEVEWLEAGDTGKKVPIVFNYGHGGYGFQSSWASADIALTLLEDATSQTLAK